MEINHTVSAILRGRWLLDKQWAHAHRPLAIRLMQGEQVDFGHVRADKEISSNENLSVAGHHPAGRATTARNVFPVNKWTNLEELPSGSIAMVSMFGPLLKYGDVCSSGMIDHTETFNRLASASNIGGILINIDSPGGQVDGTSMLSQAIKEAGRSKPVIAIIDDGMAASAAIWIASAAKEIYVTQPTDRVGSVGVYVTIADWDSHYRDYFKLKVKDIYAPQSTDKNQDYIEALKGNEERLKEDISVIADQFIKTISVNRYGVIKGSDWKTGKMFYAKEAVEIGLIDGIKSLTQIIKRMESLISQKKQSASNTAAFKSANNPTNRPIQRQVAQNGSSASSPIKVADKPQKSRPVEYVDDGSRELVNRYVNRKPESVSSTENVRPRVKYVDDGSKALAGTYKAVDRSTKPNWYVDDGSSALAGTHKHIDRSAKPSWYVDDGSEALAKGKD